MDFEEKYVNGKLIPRKELIDDIKTYNIYEDEDIEVLLDKGIRKDIEGAIDTKSYHKISLNIYDSYEINVYGHRFETVDEYNKRIAELEQKTNKKTLNKESLRKEIKKKMESLNRQLEKLKD